MALNVVPQPGNFSGKFSSDVFVNPRHSRIPTVPTDHSADHLVQDVRETAHPAKDFDGRTIV